MRLICLLLIALAPPVCAQVRATAKISEEQGGFDGMLDRYAHFGESVAMLGDLDGDGNVDLAVGAPWANSGAPAAGQVWVLFLDSQGAVRDELALGVGLGGFGGSLAQNDFFGTALASPGDLNGDGVPDLLVGARGSNVGATDAGAVWVLFLQADGTVASERAIDGTSGDLVVPLAAGDSFGAALASLGDLDQDGSPEVAVGVPGDGNTGAVRILELAPDGTVIGEVELDDGDFVDPLASGDELGEALARLGDLDRNGVADLAVGATDSADGYGYVTIVYLDTTGQPTWTTRISQDEGGLQADLEPRGKFGGALAGPGDWNADGTPDLAVSAPLTNLAGETDVGRFWILFLAPDGTVAAELGFGDGGGCFEGMLDKADLFGSSLAFAGDLDANGTVELLVGAINDDDTSGGCPFLNACDRGAVYLLSYGTTLGATAVQRNGSGVNALRYTALGGPVTGTTWTATVDTSGHAGALFAVVVGYERALAGVPTNYGELLVDPTSPYVFGSIGFVAGTTAQVSLPIPDDICLAGLASASQAYLSGGGVELTNALDLTVGF